MKAREEVAPKMLERLCRLLRRKRCAEQADARHKYVRIDAELLGASADDDAGAERLAQQVHRLAKHVPPASHIGFRPEEREQRVSADEFTRRGHGEIHEDAEPLGL